MRVIFVRLGSKIFVDYAGDQVAIGCAASEWRSDKRTGEVIAEMSQQTDGLRSQQERFLEEVFNLGRQYEQKLQEEAKLREDNELRRRFLQEGIFD